MVRSILIGTALLAASTLVAFAHDSETVTETRRDYRAEVVDAGPGHQGREYVQNGVLVIEGAPRWTEFRQSSTTSSRIGTILEPLTRIFE